MHTELMHPAADIQYVHIPFVAADWRGLNFLRILQQGVPGFNEIGPHGLAFGSYSVTVYRQMPLGIVKAVDTPIIVDRSNGVITFWKTSRVPAFSGIVEIR
jgi:hypothetical protein